VSKKCLFALIGAAFLGIIMIVWLAQSMREAALWGIWFGGLTAVIGIYTEGNVRQSKIISENYRPELDK